MEISGFYFWRMLDYGIYTQAIGSEIYIHDNIIIDAIVGICNIVVGNGKVTKHEHGDMMISIDANYFVGRSSHHTCQDYTIRQNARIVTSGLTGKNRAEYAAGGGHTALYIPLFTEKVTKFPKKALHDPKEGTYSSPNGRSCANSNVFVGYQADESCNRIPNIYTDNPKGLDHQHMFEIQKTQILSSDSALFVHFYRPKLKNVNLADCVDLSCDGKRKVFIKDMDGTLSTLGVETSIFAQSEYQWRGVPNFDWSNSVDDSFGLGDYRIPESMMTATNGSVTPIETYAPFKGISRGDTCSFNPEWVAYVCIGSQRGHMTFESMDFDTEVRRIAPIGLRSSTGYIDISNGPHDNSCCAGYACSLRASINYFVVECGETYDFHTTGTMPTKVMFSLNHMPPHCKVKIQMYAMRQNRQDIYLNGNNMIYSNQYDFLTDTWRFPDPALKPDLLDTSGSNYYDRADQMLYFILGGGDQLQVKIANSIILTLDVVTDMTIQEFYDSKDLAYLLAAMLGLDPSQVKIVTVVKETHGKHWRFSNTFVSKPHLRNDINTIASFEISNELGGTSRSEVNFDNVGNTIVAMQMDGSFESSLMDVASQNNKTIEVAATSITGEAVQGDVPAWYEEGTDGAEVSILTELDIDPDSITDEVDITDLITTAAEELGVSNLLNETVIEAQAELEEALGKTTEPVVYSAIPSTLKVTQEPESVVVKNIMKKPIKIIMLDQDDVPMTEVGYTGDPMRITALASGRNGEEIVNSETYFTPGSGVASFGGLALNYVGQYSLIVSLSYTGLANLTVESITTMAFDVTEAPPHRIAIEQQPANSVIQQKTMDPIKIIMYDSNNDQMVGNILDESDPWQICASIPSNHTGTLFGTLKRPFINGAVTFDDISLLETVNNIQIQFDVCYVGSGVNLTEVDLSPVLTTEFDVEQNVNLTRCINDQTYDENLQFKTDIFGPGVLIVKVISGRGFLGNNGNPAVGYNDPPYGNDTFHLAGDTVRVGCKLGFVNGIGKPFVGAVCSCSGTSECTFQLANPEYSCIPEADQAIPVWMGGVFNFIKGNCI